MRLSVERLRLGLIAGAVLLLAVLAVYVGYGRYRALLNWRRIIQHAGISITHDTNGFTYSQSDGKRTIFTLHAKKAIPHGDGKYSLQDADLTLYGRVTGGSDRIYGKDFEYDEKEGVARALGDVYMELDAPQTVAAKARASAPGAGPAPNAQVIYVRTSGVVYLRKLGVAATDQDVEFQWAGMHCHARGAEFNPGQSTLHLLADVHLTGDLRGQPFTLDAGTANLDRTANIVDLAQPVFNSQGRTARANHAVAYLRQDGSIQRGEATGAVELSAGTRQVNASRLDATLSPTSQPQTARLSGGVTLVDTSSTRPMHGSAQTVDAVFDAHGTPTTVIATGSASATMTDRTAKGPALNREMHGDHVVATFVPLGRKSAARLSQLQATGSAQARGDSISTSAKGPAQLKTTQIAADDLRAVFGANAQNRPLLQQLFGTGHTRLQQDAPLAEQQTSSGDSLEMVFSNAASSPAEKPEPRIASAVQTGHVLIHTRAAAKAGATAPPTLTTADGDRAVFDAATDHLTLTGDTHFSDGQSSLTAATVVIDQRTGDAEAHGNVRATTHNAQNSSAPASAPPSASETHILAADAKFIRAGKLAEFRGTDADPAHLWQAASQVQAAILLFDGEHRTLAARPLAAGAVIHAVFAGESAAPPPPAGPPIASPGAPGAASARKAAQPSSNVVRVASQRMDYADLQREATFAGSVRIDGTMGEVTAQRAVVILVPAPKPSADSHHATPQPPNQPNPFGGSIDRIVVYGDVQFDQPDRHGTGDELVYTAATDNFVLTGTPGHPPHVVDAQQGNVTGTTLLFGRSGSTIVVAGAPASDRSKATRVRTETEVRSKEK